MPCGLSRPLERPEIHREADQVALCSELIQKLKTEVFERFNPKVGSAIASSMHDALAILASGAKHQYTDETKKSRPLPITTSC